MAIYEVYVPDRSAGAHRAESARFLKDRVSILALILPLVWLAWHRLWLAFAAYFVFSTVLTGFGATSYAPTVIAFSFLPGIYLLLEGHNLIAGKWESQGYQMIDLVEAESVESAELRWLARQNLSASVASPVEGPVTAGPASVWQKQKDDSPNFGLFAED